MKIKTEVSRSACYKAVQESYNKHFAGKFTMMAKYKNSRIRAVKLEDGSNVFFFRTYHPDRKVITVHSIRLSDNAVDAMQTLKNKLNMERK